VHGSFRVYSQDGTNCLRDVTEPANIHPHPSDVDFVQNLSDSDANLLHDQNYRLFLATTIQLSYLKLNSFKQTSSEQLK